MWRIFVLTGWFCLFSTQICVSQDDKTSYESQVFLIERVSKSEQRKTNDILGSNEQENLLNSTVAASMVPGESKTWYRKYIGSTTQSYNYYGCKIVEKPGFVTFDNLRVTLDELSTWLYHVEVDFRLSVSENASAGNYTIRVRYDLMHVSGGSVGDSETLTIDLAVFPIKAPSGLVSNVISINQIALEWEDNTQVENGFLIERKTDTGSFAELATVETSSTSYVDSQLSLDTKYSYRVYSFSDQGISDYSNSTSATITSVRFTPYILDDDFSGAIFVCANDLDGDGDNDILGAANNGDEISWWENLGELEFDKHLISDNYRNPTCICTADIDGDGDTDILSSVDSNSGLAWWENDGNQNFTKHTLNNYVFSNSVSANDFDGDGDIDFITSDDYYDRLSWWENDGSGNFTRHIITEEFNGVYSIVVTDFEQDGDMDIVGAGKDDDEIAWWENDGLQNFNKHLIASDFERAYSVHIADVDVDGDADVIGAANWGDEIAWWENDGNQNFTKHAIITNFYSAQAISSSDLDKDGDIDIIGSSFTRVVFWVNDGSCNFIEKELALKDPTSFFTDVTSIFPADINGNGNTDLICAYNYNDEIILWISENTPKGQIMTGTYEGENPTVSFNVINQDTITEFALWVKGSGWSIPVYRDSVTITGDSISLSYSSSSRKYTIKAKYSYDQSLWEGSYYLWDKDPWEDVVSKSGTWIAYLVVEDGPPDLQIAEESMYQPDYVEAISSEDGMIYLVPEDTDRELSTICNVCMDSVSAVADSSIRIPASDLDNGDYWLYARDTSGNLSEPAVFTITGVGMASRMGEQIRIYPNPVHSVLRIETDVTVPYTVIISAINGQSLYFKESVDPIHQVDLSTFRTGIYFITIRSQDAVTTRKISKL